MIPIRTSPNGTMNTIPSPRQPIDSMESVNKSVGLEFVEWAEKSWDLKDIVKFSDHKDYQGEIFEYNHLRGVFVDKINALIAEKLAL